MWCRSRFANRNGRSIMAENNEGVFVVDDDLIERLLRGDTVEDPSKKKRPIASSALAAAVKLASEGRIDDAVKELERAAAKGESPNEVHTALGHLKFEQQNWSEAANWYRKVTTADAKHRTAHYNLALCLERQGKFADAASGFEYALSIDPKRWQAHLARGLCLLQLGKADLALECFLANLKESPAQDQALFGKAVALHQPGKLDET